MECLTLLVLYPESVFRNGVYHHEGSALKTWLIRPLADTKFGGFIAPRRQARQVRYFPPNFAPFAPLRESSGLSSRPSCPRGEQRNLEGYAHQFKRHYTRYPIRGTFAGCCASAGTQSAKSRAPRARPITFLLIDFLPGPRATIQQHKRCLKT